MTSATTTDYINNPVIPHRIATCNLQRKKFRKPEKALCSDEILAGRRRRTLLTGPGGSLI